MRVFVTGATGFVGAAVVRELVAAGHQVLGLVRSPQGAASLTAVGAEALQGSLEDLDSLRRGAASADGVVHTAFNHDFSKFAQNCELDRSAIEALGEALAGSDRPLVVTSGFAHISPGRLSTEDDVPIPPAGGRAIPRVSEATAMRLAEQGVHAMVMRLPPSVHGLGDHGFVPMLAKMAREKGVSVYGGDGAHRWPAVHRLDAARAYRLAVEKGRAGARYHAVAEEGVPFREIAQVIAHRLKLPLASRTPEAAAAHFGWFASFAAMDVPASSERTREELGWHFAEAGLITDVDQPGYLD
jgi:nucleoside-diphosphate-sugar epimerase